MKRLLFAALLLGCAAASRAAAPACGGDLEADVWKLWDDRAHQFERQNILEDQFVAHGDTYALYDMQAHLHSLAALAERCSRPNRLWELAELVGVAFDHATDMPAASGGGKGWICQGGRVCNAANRLAGTEVKLTTVQFMLFANRVARGLATQAPSDPRTSKFFARVLAFDVDHLERWSSGPDGLRVAKRLGARPEDIRDGSSELFFNDEDLMKIAIYADAAGLSKLLGMGAPPWTTRERGERARNGLHDLLKLFNARVDVRTLASSRIGKVEVADIDRGYWRLYRDNRYAGDESETKPVTCGAGKAAERPGAANVPLLATAGWDFSHARRLVPVLDALDRNVNSMERAYDLPKSLAWSPHRANPFIAELVAVIWNGDERRPLFANYWGGANGWYRVNYQASGSGCFEGYPPYGLSDTFANGGFAEWRRYQPMVGDLGDRILALTKSDDASDKAFIQTHYPGLAPSASNGTRMLNQIMFWPGLIAGPGGDRP